MFHVKHPAGVQLTADVQRVARAVFGDHYGLAERYAELLAGPGLTRGVIGPREAERLWERHLLNSAVLGELVPKDCRVLDVGSGAGLPGIPLAIARPDLTVVLLEPLARRIAWLREVVDELGLDVAVHRGRAEEPRIRAELGGNDVVTARAVAPLGRLVEWALPLVTPGGRLLAIKGASAEEELARDIDAVRAAGGAGAEIVCCGSTIMRPPATVIVVPVMAQPAKTKQVMSKPVAREPAMSKPWPAQRVRSPARARRRKDR